MKFGGAGRLLLIGSLFGGDTRGYSRATSASDTKPRKQNRHADELLCQIA